MPAKAVVHACMDRHIESNIDTFRQSRATGDTTLYLATWSRCIEEGLLDAQGVLLDQRPAMRGRGKPTVTVKPCQWAHA
eukprot:3711960-Alexandrium_andersonii.AAC.1